jgi:hypothetical protein
MCEEYIYPTKVHRALTTPTTQLDTQSHDSELDSFEVSLETSL